MNARANSPGREIRPSLRREILVVLAFKAIVLIVLYSLFFGPSSHARVTASDIAATLLGSTPRDERP